MMAVFLALKTFLPVLKEYHILVRSDNMAGMAFINHQGGLRSKSLQDGKTPTYSHTTTSSKYNVFGRVEVDFFALEDNSYCQTFYQRTEMPWPMTSPVLTCMLSLQLPCSLRVIR